MQEDGQVLIVCDGFLMPRIAQENRNLAQAKELTDASVIQMCAQIFSVLTRSRLCKFKKSTKNKSEVHKYRTRIYRTFVMIIDVFRLQEEQGPTCNRQVKSEQNYLI